MEVIPSIDLRAGRCVRLFQGDFQQETVFSDDPVGVALEWQGQGAARLHLVDLEGAVSGLPVNLSTVRHIVEALDIPVQVGGGIRSRETAEALFSAGADRVVIGTAAVEDPELVRELCRDAGGERVVIAVDARDGIVAIKGWTESSTVSAVELGIRMGQMGVVRLLYTDVSRDGTLSSPNFAANAALVSQTGLKVQASGGVSSLEHIRQLVPTGAEGVIVGTALYRRTINLSEAIQIGASQD